MKRTLKYILPAFAVFAPFANAAIVAQFDLGTATSPVATDFMRVTTSGSATQNSITITLTPDVGSTTLDARDRAGNPDGLDNGTSDADALYRDFIFLSSNAEGETLTVEFTGLLANTQYNITSFHFESSGGQVNFQTDWYADSTSGTLLGTWDGARSATFDDGDSVEFSTTISDATGKISLVAEAVVGPLRLNGFTVEQVPEPSSLLLSGLGLLALLRRRR